MSGPEDDAEASTMAVHRVDVTVPDHRPVPATENLGAGAMVGRYRLEARLGAGAMGVVWSARDPELERDVAIKLVHPALHSEEAASRFRREARAMAKLSHRAVITVHDTGVVDGQLFLAMELVRGTTLGQLLRERDATAIADWPRWLAMMIEAGRGLAEAHENGVLHRDFKPDNVLVDRAGRVCVGDFGLASLGDRPAARPSVPVTPVTLGDSVAFDLTSTGAVLGTPLYMSPQQLNAEAIDERADQFAFCVALHEAMYGHRPFTTEAQGLAAIPGLMERIGSGVPPPPPGSPVPRAIYDCIARGLAYEPEDRWPDMDTLLAALEAVTRRPSAAAPAPRPRRWIPFAFAGVVAVGLVVFFAARSPSVEAPPPPAPAPPVETKPPPKPLAELTNLFSTPLNTRTAISADGRFLALGGDLLEVRSLDEDGLPSAPINSIRVTGAALLYLEVDDQEVRFSSQVGANRWRWRYRESKEIIEIDRTLPGPWRGTTVAGELVRGKDRSLGIAKADTTVEWWPVANIEIALVSPDRKRVAYVEGGRFTGTISVRDVTTGTVVTSPTIDEPMSLAWFDPTHLLYASSTMVEPTLFRVEVGTAFGKPEVLYKQAIGWFSDLGVGGKNMFAVSMSPTPRGRVTDRKARRTDELDSVSLGLGWDASDRIVTWSRGNQQITSHAGALPSEPANATRSGDTLIATVRVLGGRRAIALSLTTGATRWRIDDKRTIAVRCAGDRAPPCFAIRYIDETLDQVVTLDPETGVLGDKPIYEQRKIEDLAVRDDGKALLVTKGSGLVEITSQGTLIAELAMRDEKQKVRLNLIRSVAYSKRGYIVAGTIGRNAYQVGEMRDGAYEPIDNAFDKILMLVRPSADDERIAFIARGYAPELYRLRLP